MASRFRLARIDRTTSRILSILLAQHPLYMARKEGTYIMDPRAFGIVLIQVGLHIATMRLSSGMLIVATILVVVLAEAAIVLFAFSKLLSEGQPGAHRVLAQASTPRRPSDRQAAHRGVTKRAA